ncbi:ATP-binding protein [Streptomyces sp. DSM 44917]|uniref:ATP-binding protein n=1 Tax=Streptomyces boetiae TaxID=3075541 RepID=A0ABU2L5T0_9ACTN|nr:ATP-binding protein [Streptomyces sp. DSM 44917]MDT0306918.1 ATP-binding protein [Streptomyces sp. DSM 44917]
MAATAESPAAGGTESRVPEGPAAWPLGPEPVLDADLLDDPSPGEIRLPAVPSSAAVARRLTRRQLQQRWLLPPELAEEAVLLVSELVGNAVQHAGALSFGLRVRRRRGWIRCEVSDPSRSLPCRLPVREMDVLTGRGLFLVDTLADRWGVDLLPQGKTTWFEMRVPGH